MKSKGKSGLLLSVCLILETTKNVPFSLLKKWIHVSQPIYCSVKLITTNLPVKMGRTNWLDHTNSSYNTGEKVPHSLKRHMHRQKLMALVQFNSCCLCWEMWMSLIITKKKNHLILLDLILTSIKSTALFCSLPIPSVCQKWRGEIIKKHNHRISR